MKVAGAWSIDPTTLEEHNETPTGLGLVGR
jgi:hypothetical protein